MVSKLHNSKFNLLLLLSITVPSALRQYISKSIWYISWLRPAANHPKRPPKPLKTATGSTAYRQGSTSYRQGVTRSKTEILKGPGRQFLASTRHDRASDLSNRKSHSTLVWFSSALTSNFLIGRVRREYFPLHGRNCCPPRRPQKRQVLRPVLPSSCLTRGTWPSGFSNQ